MVGTLWSMVATVRSGRRTRAARQAQALERLGRRDLVDQVQVDVEQVGLALGGVDDVAVPHLLAERSRGHVLVPDLIYETLISPYGHCKRDRRAGQGGFRPRRASRAGPLSLAGLVDATGLPRATAHRLAVALEVHGLVRPGRRRPLRPRPPPHRPRPARPGPARPERAAGRHGRERPALRAPGRPPPVRGLAGVAPRPAHDRAVGASLPLDVGLGRQGPPRRREAAAGLGRERGGAGAGGGVGERTRAHGGRRGGGRGVGVGPDRAHDPVARPPLRRRRGRSRRRHSSARCG